jgi:hypothetical protein
MLHLQKFTSATTITTTATTTNKKGDINHNNVVN